MNKALIWTLVGVLVIYSGYRLWLWKQEKEAAKLAVGDTETVKEEDDTMPDNLAPINRDTVEANADAALGSDGERWA